MKKHFFKKRLLIMSLIVLSHQFVTAQGLNIVSGGKLFISGSAQIIINNGNFENNGLYRKGTELVILSGTTAKSMYGNGTTDMYNLSVTNTGGITTKLELLNLHNLSISSSSKFTIDTTRAVVASNSIVNNAGASGLIIKSSSIAANGSVIFHNSSESPLVATVEMYSKAFWDLNATTSAKYKWQFLGIPVTSVPVNPTFAGAYIRKYNEAGNGSGYTSNKRWIQLTPESTIYPFLGYELVQAAGKLYSFSGYLINSDYTQTLSYTPSADYTGQHLFSNPYTAAIDITKLKFGPETEASVYLYNTGSYGDWTNYAISGNSPGQYVVSPQNLAGTDEIPGQIPSMQGFLIKAKSLTDSAYIKIPYSSVATKNTDKQRVKSINNITNNRIYTRIDIQGTRSSDKMWIFTDPNFTKGFDNGWDGAKFLGASLSPQLWAIETDGDYQIDAVSDINNTRLGFIAGEDMQYTLTFNHSNSESTYPQLYLIDLLDNNKTIDISANGSQYKFNTIYDDVNRFKIVTNLGTITHNATTSTTKLKIYSAAKTIFIQNESNLNGEIKIYDLTGRNINTYMFKANALTTIATSLNNGCYLIQGLTSNEKISRQIIIGEDKGF